MNFENFLKEFEDYRCAIICSDIKERRKVTGVLLDELGFNDVTGGRMKSEDFSYPNIMSEGKDIVYSRRALSRLPYYVDAADFLGMAGAATNDEQYTQPTDEAISKLFTRE